MRIAHASKFINHKPSIKITRVTALLLTFCMLFCSAIVPATANGVAAADNSALENTSSE